MKICFLPNALLIYKILNRSCSFPESSTLTFSYYEILFYDISHLNLSHPSRHPFLMPTDNDFALERGDGNINIHLLCRFFFIIAIKNTFKKYRGIIEIQSSIQSAAIAFICRCSRSTGWSFHSKMQNCKDWRLELWGNSWKYTQHQDVIWWKSSTVDIFRHPIKTIYNLICLALQ